MPSLPHPPHTTVVHRQDYAPPAYWIDSVDLTLDLDPAKTRVLNKMCLRRNPLVPPQALHLQGQDLSLARVLVNGTGWSFRLTDTELVLDNLPEGDAPIELEIFTICAPEKNTQLMGLYLSQGTFFTQCEAQGFRRITYFADRPDIMACYSVTLRANQARYPVLLSNGNLVETGPLPEGRHFAKWVDPHKKPCYLFAIVAGQLVAREQRITSRSGTEHLLQIYVRPGDLDQTDHAMQSLMASIAWDEARFGLPLDLERFMIVATSDFNMGAMENKGLNIFNTKYILANSSTATDADFAHIESVVAHEYLHNWTGNRVTCRDWFELSLKEGLTVFRDQEFSMDMCAHASARAVKRIEDVRALRTIQFAEDAGPMAHPVRPESYAEINNFYTATVYEKGAEVVRMMQTLVGRQGLAQGLKHYFERHDGQAVTCDDFMQAVADANPQSELPRLLPQFARWYSQAGTPRLQAQGRFDAQAGTYTLTLTQHAPHLPSQPSPQPWVIPVTIGLLDANSGAELPLHMAHWSQAQTGSHTLVLEQTSQSFTFINLASEPLPSLLRSFSAPVILEMNYSEAQLLRLLAHDSDPFNRWEAAQQLAMRCALPAIACPDPESVTLSQPLNAPYLDAMRGVLRQPDLDAGFKHLLLTLPSQTYMAEQLPSLDPQRVHTVHQAMNEQLARTLHADWERAYHAHKDNGTYRPDMLSAGRRALAGLALTMLCLAARGQPQSPWPAHAWARYKTAGNMTDRLNALSALIQGGHPQAEEALAHLHRTAQGQALVIDKWFALQAGAPERQGQILAQVRQLLAHPDFNLSNPNRARSLIFSYCLGNPAAFHRPDGAGYLLWSQYVLEIDRFNPQLAARLGRALERWSKLQEPYRSAAHQALSQVAQRPDLSADLREVISRALAN